MPGVMPRHLIVALVTLLAAAAPSSAVDLTGQWVICADCRIGGVCDPSGSPTDIDEWTVTQAGSSLTVMESVFGLTLTGTIDPPSGAFDLPRPPNLISFEGV